MSWTRTVKNLVCFYHIDVESMLTIIVVIESH